MDAASMAIGPYVASLACLMKLAGPSQRDVIPQSNIRSVAF
jgi:hypothetical protein